MAYRIGYSSSRDCGTSSASSALAAGLKRDRPSHISRVCATDLTRKLAPGVGRFADLSAWPEPVSTPSFIASEMPRDFVHSDRVGGCDSRVTRVFSPSSSRTSVLSMAGRRLRFLTICCAAARISMRHPSQVSSDLEQMLTAQINRSQARFPSRTRYRHLPKGRAFGRENGLESDAERFVFRIREGFPNQQMSDL